MAFMKFSKGKKIYSVPNGLGDGSAYFDGNSYAKKNSGLEILPSGSNPCSFSVWFNLKYFNTYEQIFAYGRYTNNGERGLLVYKKHLYSWGYANDYEYTNTKIELNTWYHVVMVHENATEKVYLNGQLVGERSFKFNTGLDELCIGMHDNTYCLTGNIKEVQVYNRVLSTDEVTQLYNKQEITSGRVLNIPLQYEKDDDSIFSSKNFVYDYSIVETSSGFNTLGKPIGYRSASGCGINYSPMLVKDGLVFYAPLQKDIAPIIGNAPSLSGNATFGEVNGIKCLQCNGNTRIDYPQTADLPTGNAPRTMSAWISSSYNRGSWDFACGFGGEDEYTMSYCFYGQRLRLYRRDMNDSYTFINGYPYDNTWVHCLTTFDGTTVKTYANGVLTFYFNVSYATSNRSIYLGYLGTQNAFNYYGNIASFRIYNRALTEKEIQQLANEFK